MHLKRVCDASRLTDLEKNEAVIYARLLKRQMHIALIPFIVGLEKGVKISGLSCLLLFMNFHWSSLN